MNKSAVKIQNRYWLRGRNTILRCLAVCSMGMIARIRIENIRASTPPSLLGMDRKIA